MGQKKVLIVDDEENIRSLIKEVVGALGHQVYLAENGQEAFRTATSEEVDLILLDIMMPDWNGVDAIRSLDFINKKPKIIIVSGYISDQLTSDLKATENVVGYITKPFKLNELRETITNVLDE